MGGSHLEPWEEALSEPETLCRQVGEMSGSE